MDNFKSILGDAAGGALCNVLTAYGSAAPALFAFSLIEPTPFGEVAATTAGLAGVAAAFGCTWDPDAQGPPGGNGYTGCNKYTNGGGRMTAIETDGSRRIQFSFLEITAFTVESNPPGGSPGQVAYRFDYVDLNGQDTFARFFPVPDARRDFQTEPIVQGDTCDTPAPPITPPDPPTYTHTDPASGCELNVNFKGWGVNTADNINGVWEITPALPPARASTGPITGCNFAPVFYIDDGGGGDGGGRYFTIPDPIPPDGDEPWWVPFIRGLGAGLAEAATLAAIGQLFETEYVGGSYQLKGVCELDPDGNPMDVTRSVNFPQAPSPQAILLRLDALADMFQFHKDLRQPTCKEEPIPQTGDPVTINFESAQRSVNGADYLRKRFVYFDQVNSTLEDTVNHWRDFTWVAGPVIVNCLGTKLGKPQVWAASLDEAKRVFAHAAAIAGVDLTDAKYPASTPKDPRYGQPGLMHVSRDQFGTFGITKRSGPSGSPIGLA